MNPSFTINWIGQDLTWNIGCSKMAAEKKVKECTSRPIAQTPRNSLPKVMCAYESLEDRDSHCICTFGPCENIMIRGRAHHHFLRGESSRSNLHTRCVTKRHAQPGCVQGQAD
jgi:hypothetical protein